MSSRFRKIIITSFATAFGVGTTYLLLTDERERKWGTVSAKTKFCFQKGPLPSREELINSLKNDCFDVLVIGGGATGAGCALDAQTRGLKTALIEADDFSSGTSSRSTKLLHGGVRYLQKAIMQLDIEQYRMVKEALHERATVLDSAPHLAKPLPIMLPVYTWWQVPYFYAGIKMYDIVAAGKTLKSSYLLSKKNALELFPMLKGEKLRGAIVYYDGQQDDARMNLAIALTAIRYGATAVNHVSCKKLIKEPGKDGKPGILKGAVVKDNLTNNEWEVKAKCVINATGPFTDTIRKMDDPTVKSICSPSSGVHIVLPGYYSPEQMGLLDPATSDGRVIFFLPFQNHTIAGTTDLPCDVTFSPKPTEEEILFILSEVKHYLNPDVEVRRGDVLSAWSGIRPLVSDPNKADTQSLARNHIIHVSPSKLITIAGGKWTTYRHMAEETIDTAIKCIELEPIYKECQTQNIKLEGADNWTPTMYIRLVQDFGLEFETAQHLATAYGDRAFHVAKMACLTGKRWPIIGKKIHPEFPYIDADIKYGVKEYAMTAVDMIGRRLRIAFLNVQAAQEALPDIIDIMGEELKWSDAEKQRQEALATEFLQYEMGQMMNRASRDKNPANLTDNEVNTFTKRFEIVDKDSKGYVSINDIRRSLKRDDGTDVPGEELHEILKEIDTNMNGQVELDEYLQLMAAIKSGRVAYSRFARMAELEEAKYEASLLKKKISVERSGGGL
ncbi:glycerol-3-phosphate dehydrogenase, mitochondrial [Onthophagus taurus]|uniref:glycerol-3-phosphate dehydrogenase, mitochondrial n=1 Tax=Onthophagus taurus TaxID=166361 RepID=UPI0039BDD898